MFAVLASAERLMERLSALPPCDLMDDLERDLPEVRRARCAFACLGLLIQDDAEGGQVSSLPP